MACNSCNSANQQNYFQRITNSAAGLDADNITQVNQIEALLHIGKDLDFMPCILTPLEYPEFVTSLSRVANLNSAIQIDTFVTLARQLDMFDSLREMVSIAFYAGLLNPLVAVALVDSDYEPLTTLLNVAENSVYENFFTQVCDTLLVEEIDGELIDPDDIDAEVEAQFNL